MSERKTEPMSDAAAELTDFRKAGGGHGAVAAGHPETAAAGAHILRQGGNAVDAAVAAAFASFVAEASIVNIGGSGVALVVDGRRSLQTAYDFFSVMPSGAFTPDADFHQVLVDFGVEQQPFHIGRASVAVPGAVAGLCHMASEHGTLPLSKLVAPAVALAEQGALLTEGLSYAYRILQPIFQDTPALAALYTHDGQPYRVGDRMVFPALARTLTQLGKEGPDLFYRGALAAEILADQRANRGLLQPEDLARYRVRSTDPIRVPYRGHEILLTPPSSLGGVLIGFALGLLSGFNLQALAHNRTEHLRMVAEVMRFTNIARVDWDSSNLPIPERLAWFLADEQLDAYRTLLAHALESGASPADAPQPRSANDTTHISVVDARGMQVSITTSAGENAGFVVGDTGVCLNNMLGEADLHPQGFHMQPPGTRLVTMMTPVVVEADGRPILTLGSGGSNRIRSAILQVISNVLDFGLPLAAAVDAPRIHFEAGILQAEGGIPLDVLAGLQAYRYQINAWEDRNMYFGGAHAVALEEGKLIAAGDRRRGGSTELV